MRNMSFALTTAQVHAQSKDVTRRLGWQFLKVGDFIQPVLKCMGLKPGESVQKIGGAIRVEALSRERLDAITPEECVREGFPEMTPAQFVTMFCKANGCKPSTVVTRIEFRYMPTPAGANPLQTAISETMARIPTVARLYYTGSPTRRYMRASTQNGPGEPLVHRSHVERELLRILVEAGVRASIRQSLEGEKK